MLPKKPDPGFKLIEIEEEGGPENNSPRTGIVKGKVTPVTPYQDTIQVPDIVTETASYRSVILADRPTGNSVTPPAAPLRLRESLSFSVLDWADLPIPATLIARDRLGAVLRPVVFTASRTHHAAAIGAHAPTWAPREYEALVVAVAHGLASRDDFGRWCQRKLAEPAWRLEARHAYAGRAGVSRDVALGRVWWDGADGGRGGWLPRGWTWERLFAALDLELVDVVLDGDALPALDVARSEAA